MYDFGIILSKNISDILLLSIQEELKNFDFSLEVIRTDDDIVLLIKQEKAARILQTLSDLKFEKPKYSKKSFKEIELNENAVNKREFKYTQFVKSRQQLKKIHPQVVQLEQFTKFKYKDRYKFIKTSSENLSDQEILSEVFLPYEKEIAIYQILALIKLPDRIKSLIQDDKKEKEDQILGRKDFLFVYLKQNEILKDLAPLSQHTKWNLNLNIVEQTRKYFGEQVAIYFAFLKYLIEQLVFLVILGIITFLLDEYFDEDVNTSPFETIYAMVTIIWASLFIGRWYNYEKQLKFLWRSEGKRFEHYQLTLQQSLMKCITHDEYEEEIEQIEQENIQFSTQHLKEIRRIDPVTGLQINDDRRNLLKIYFNSFVRTAPFLIVTACFLIISLNVRGYIIEEHTWINFKSLSALSEEGGIFDKNTNKANITTIIHVLVIFFLNEQYKKVSVQTSLKEQHSSFHAFEGSLIIKRFIFETLSSFTDFFYIGFVRFDILALKSEMVSMFAFDEIRRVIFETLIPLMQKRSLVKKLQLKPHSEQLISLYLPKYESFDDYLEVILNFGYLTFFTSAYPLASIVIAFFMAIEFISDHFKVYQLYQKPISMKTEGLGPWASSMDVICVMSVFSNLILFAFASDKIVEFFPYLFEETGHHHLLYKPRIYHNSYFPNIADHMLLMAKPLPGKGQYMVAIVFAIEHILFIAMWGLRQFIKQKKSWGEIYKERMEYKKQVK